MREESGFCVCEALEPRQLLSGSVRFAVLGDFGADSIEEAEVAGLVKSWGPDLIITVGDNNYPSGAASTIDRNIGKYFQEFIFPYDGAYGSGSADGENHFFPTLGNHDWYTAGAQPYLDYFTLPGNERYYTFRVGPVQFFALDSDRHEPDLGYVNATTSTEDSVQAQWLKQTLSESTAEWKIVYFHHAPYSSGSVHGSSRWMQWPFEEWGATAVLAGHVHNYERLQIGNLPYFVNGAGGDSLYGFGEPIPGSQVRYNADYGAMFVEASDNQIRFQFTTRSGVTIDTYTITLPPPPPPPVLLPWADATVGWHKVPGQASYEKGFFTIQGAGHDIGGKRDAFHYVYQPLVGDGQIIARVRSMDPTDPRAKAGVMIRKTLRGDSPYAAMLLTPSGSAFYQQRTVRRQPSDYTGKPRTALPYYVKLVREGNIVTGYLSRRGRRWILMGQTYLRARGGVYVGLAVSSHKRGTLNTSTFAKVRIEPLTTQASGLMPEAQPLTFSVASKAAAISADGSNRPREVFARSFSWISPVNARLHRILGDDQSRAAVYAREPLMTRLVRLNIGRLEF